MRPNNASPASRPVLVLQRMPHADQALDEAWKEHELEVLEPDVLRQRGKMWACFTHHTDSNPCSK